MDQYTVRLENVTRSYGQEAGRTIGVRDVSFHDPAVLLLDEPTNGLDPAAAATFEDLIIRERANGKTIVLATHNLNVAEKLADAIAILDHGQLAHLERYEAGPARGTSLQRSDLERLYFRITRPPEEQSCSRS